MAISPRCPLRALILAGVSAAAFAVPSAAIAGGPTGGTVARGTAEIVRGNGRTVIRQQSRRAVIDWQGFNVGRNHTVVFAQPGRNAATLNRVDTVAPSVIRGAVRAPGTVVVQNGAGILFAGSAKVDTGGLVATGQTVDTGGFMRGGHIRAHGGEVPGARIVNRGEITVGEAGLVALVGRDVENAGAIVARRGTVALAGGSRSTIDLTGDGMVKLAVAGSGLVTQNGTLAADGGRVVITAGAAAAALDAAINTGGLIRADGRRGRIEIVGRGKAAVRVTGVLRATGGTVSVAARDVTVARQATLAARGGTVAALAREATLVRGRIEAEGGFVETSALGSVGISRGAQVSVGAGGTWLIDPRDIVIGNSGSSPGGTPAGNTALTISRVALQNALNAGTDVTISTAQQASSMAGDITVAGALNWTGTGDLTLLADRDIVIAAPITTRDGDVTARATRNVRIDADLRATGTAAVSLAAAQGWLRVARASSSVGQVLATDTGALRLEAARGKLEIGRVGGTSGWIQVGSGSGATTIRAGDEIHVWGADINGGWTRIGSEDSRSTVTLAAPAVTIRGGAGATSFAEVVAGAGGSLTLDGGSRIVVTGTTAEGRVAALDGAPLTLRAPYQYWDGAVRAGSGASDGGDVRIAGSVVAPVRPLFSLAPGSDFILAATGPTGAASGYRSDQPFAVSTTGTGIVAVEAPVSATQVTLLSGAAVHLGASAHLQGTGTGDAVVVAAGHRFVNDAGADVLEGDRWLLYLDRFDGLDGTAPASEGFDLYGRSYATTPPAALGFGGDRIVYAERPVLTLTAESLTKVYGSGAAPGVSAAGLRPGDNLTTALAGAPTAGSAGSAADTPVGTYPTRVSATASAQGYTLAVVPGTLTVTPAALTVTAANARRRYGDSDPAFAARFDGFVLGEGEEALVGALTFTAAAGRSSPVGQYALVPGGLASANYDIRYQAGTLTVERAPLTVTALDAARSYGAGNPALGVRYDGFVLGEDASVLGGTLAVATEAGRESGVGRYAISAAGLSSGNYAIRYRTGTLAVEPAALTVTVPDAARRYGAGNPAFAVRYDGFVLGEDASSLSGTLTLATTAGRDADVGRYAIAAGGLASGNYAISYRPGTLTVEPAALTVTAADSGRDVGAANPDFTARFDGFVLGQDADDLQGTLRFATEAGRESPAGRYALTPAGLSGRNYRISYVPGVLTVTEPVPVPAGPLAALRPFSRGVAPLTPGDASFRTTVAEAPPAISNPFDLSYSLGEVGELAAPGTAGAEGFVAAAADTGGFTPAAGGAPQAAAPERNDRAPAGPCRGAVNRGAAATGCGVRTIAESYWASR